MLRECNVPRIRWNLIVGVYVVRKAFEETACWGAPGLRHRGDRNTCAQGTTFPEPAARRARDELNRLVAPRLHSLPRSPILHGHPPRIPFRLLEYEPPDQVPAARTDHDAKWRSVKIALQWLIRHAAYSVPLMCAKELTAPPDTVVAQGIRDETEPWRPWLRQGDAP